MPSIGFDNSIQQGGIGSSPFTLAYTNNGNFVAIAIENNSISSVTYGGVSMTQAAGSPIVHGASGTLAIFYLINPPTGPNNFVITYTGSGTSVAVAASWTNVDTAISPEVISTDLTSNAAAGSPAAYTINPAVTTISDNDWLVTFATSNATWTQHAGTNLRQTISPGVYVADRGPCTPPGAFTTTVDTNFNGGVNIASMTLALKPLGITPVTKTVSDQATYGDNVNFSFGSIPVAGPIVTRSQQIWTDEQISQWETDAIGQINVDVKCIFARECLPIQRGVSVYTLPSYVRTLRRITFRGKSLDAESWEELTLLSPATVGGYLETSLSRPLYYAMHPTNPYDIRLYPTPAETFTANGEPNVYAPQVNTPSCIIEYDREPDITNLNPVISLPPYILRRTQKAYVLWRAFAAEGKGQDSRMAGYYKQKYDFLIGYFRSINEGCFVAKRYALENGTLALDTYRYPKPILPTNFEAERF